MARFLRVVLAPFCFCALFADLASGEVFERDWKTPGDGLLTYDDVNQREWLDLSVSRLDQFAEPRLENAIAEIAPGGLFEGFTFATRDDVLAFAQSAGLDTSTHSYAVNQWSASKVLGLLGMTVQTSETSRSIGFINETTPATQVVANFFISPESGPIGRAGLAISSTDDFLMRTSNGLMLYRIIPEPSSVFLAMSGIYSLSCIFRRRSPKRVC